MQTSLEWVRLKWSVFTYNFGWPDWVFLFDGWLAKASLAIPVVGYLILFNDQAAGYLSFNKLSSENTIDLGLTPGSRLKFLYLGMLFLAAANALYYLRRPYAMKIGTDEFSYTERALQHFTVSDYVQIDGEIRRSGFDPYTIHGKYYDSEFENFIYAATGQRRGNSPSDEPDQFHFDDAKKQHESLLRSMLTETFFRRKTSRRRSLTACISLAAIGYFLLIVPSADLFMKVMFVIFKPLMAGLT